MALALLVDSGYVQRDTVDSAVFNQEISHLLRRADEGTELTPIEAKQVERAKAEQHFFIRSNRIDGANNPVLERFSEINRGSGTALNDLFKTNFDLTKPTLKPVKFTQKFAKNTDRFIPEELAKNLDETNKKPYYFHSDLLSTKESEGGIKEGVLHRLDRTTIEAIAGVQNSDAQLLHVSNRDGAIAKDEGIIRQVSQVFEHLEDVLDNNVDTPFYIQNEAWKMFRVGQKSKTINPQGSKFHRALTSIGDSRWNYEVDTASGSNVNTFKYAVMEAFSLNTTGDNTRVLKQFDALIEEPELQGALEVAHKLNTDPVFVPDSEQQQMLINGTRFGGEDTHSFTALLALAKYRDANASGTAFTSNMMREGDGKNNGPVISLLTTGMSADPELSKTLMRLGGIFTKDDTFQNYDEYFEAGGKDMYQYVGDRSIDQMKTELYNVNQGFDRDPKGGKGARIYQSTPEKVAALTAIVGDLSGPDSGKFESQLGDVNTLLNPETGLINSTLRKATKGPVTQIVFGAAAQKTVENMSDWFVEAVIGKFEKHVNEPEVLEPIIDAINAAVIGVHRIEKRVDNNYLELVFTDAQHEAIRNIMLHTYGVAVKETIQSEFGNLLHSRKAINEAANMAFRAYNSVYEAMKREAIATNKNLLNQRNRLVATKSVNAKIDGLTYTFDLSSEQEADIRSQLEFMFPGVNTAFSADSANTNPDFPVGDGLSLIKNTKTSSNAGGYRSKPGFTGIKQKGFDGVTKNVAKVMTVNGLRKVMQGPGAATAVLMTHSTDSSMANRTYSKIDALNNHDAVTIAADKVQGAMQLLNANFYNSVSEYSAPMEVARMLIRVLEGHETMRDRFANDAKFQEDLANIASPEVTYDYVGTKTEEPSKQTPMEEARTHIAILAAAEDKKRKFLHTINRIDQYQSDSGSYEITEAQRVKAQEKASNDPYDELVTPENTAYLHSTQSLEQYLAGETQSVPEQQSKEVELPERVLSSAELGVLKRLNTELGRTNSLSDALAIVYKSDTTKAQLAKDHWTEQVTDNIDTVLKHIGANQFTHLRAWNSARQKAIGTPDVLAFAAPRQSVNPAIDYTTTQVFEQLNAVAPMALSKSRRLLNVLDQVVTKLHGPAGANAALVKAQFGETVAELVAKATLDGKLPFTSRAKVSGLKLSEAESFVLEQVELTVRASLTGSSTASKDVIKLFKQAKQKLDPTGRDLFQGDWSKATATEKDNARAQYDFIFRVNTDVGDTNSTHLSRFIALGMVYEPLANAINFNVDSQENFKKENFNEVIDSLFRSALRFVSDKRNNTYSGQKGKQRLDNLVQSLVGHEHKKKLEMARKFKHVNEHLEKASAQVSESVRATVAKAGRSDFFQNRDSNIIKAVGTVSADIAEDRVDEVLRALNAFRNDVFTNRRQGLISSLVTEAVGQTDETEVLFKLQDQVTTIEQKRKLLNETLGAEVSSRFDNHEELSASEKAAVTQVFIRSDLGSLLGTYDGAEIAALITDKTKLKGEIQSLVQLIENQHEQGADMVQDARALGYHLATGNNTSNNLLLNAYNIAHRFGTAEAGQVSLEANHPLISSLDRLVSLMALEQTDSTHLTFIKNILATETARGDQSGLLYVMQMHQRLKADALETLFDNNPIQMLKGYSREIYNPNNTMVISDISKGAELEALGYQYVLTLGVDARDPDTKGARAIYVLEGVGMINRETGILSFTGSNARGSGINAANSITDKSDTLVGRRARVAQVHAAKLADQAKNKRKGDFDPTADEKGKLVPVLDSKGNVANYRYTMNHANKDAVLDRDNDFAAILSGIQSNQFDKVKSKTHNREVIKSLREFFEEDFARNQNAYVEVSKGSNDPLLREAYNLLPESAKQDIRELWGEDRMFIRNDLVDMVTGYRNLSVLDPFGKDPEIRNIVEKLFVRLLEMMFGKKAAIRARQGEDLWLEGVKLLKDVVVVRNFWTLFGNVASNVSLLFWYGVPIKEIIRGHQESFDGLVRYQDDLQAVIKLKNRVGFTGIDQVKLEEDIAELEVALKTNPVNTLIEEGMFQTIQEDINIVEQDPRYENNFDAFIKAQADRLPEPIRKAGEIAVVARNTSLYKILSKATQSSDFVGRYVLYQHLTTKADPKTHDAAIADIREAFVNYDTPTNRFMQYSNITGLMMFTKYYIRVQKILAKLTRLNPARGLGLAITDHYVRSLPTIIDSNALGSFGNNPLDIGALNLMGAYDDPIPLNVLFDLVD